MDALSLSLSLIIITKGTHKVELEMIQSRNFLHHQQVVVRRTLFVLLNSSSSAFKKELSYPTPLFKDIIAPSSPFAFFFLFISFNLLHLKHEQERITTKQGNITDFAEL